MPEPSLPVFSNVTRYRPSTICAGTSKPVSVAVIVISGNPLSSIVGVATCANAEDPDRSKNTKIKAVGAFKKRIAIPFSEPVDGESLKPWRRELYGTCALRITQATAYD